MAELSDELQFPINELEKYFEQGDCVKVVEGRYKGEYGIVVKRYEQDSVVIYSDIHKKEINVLMQYLQFSSDQTDLLFQQGGYQNNYQIYDVVTSKNTGQVGMVTKVEKNALIVIMANSQKATIPIYDVNNKFSSKNACTADKEGNSINIGDMIKIVNENSPFKNKLATVRNIVRQTLFLQSNEIAQETQGIFVERAKLVCLLGRQQKQKSLQMYTYNPKVQKDELQGKVVQVRQGPYKGQTGKVVTANQKNVRIEMSSKPMTITVNRDHIQIVDSFTAALGIDNNRMMEPNQQMRTPARSPGWNASTPAYDMQSPWREATPINSPHPDYQWK